MISWPARDQSYNKLNLLKNQQVISKCTQKKKKEKKNVKQVIFRRGILLGLALDLFGCQERKAGTFVIRKIDLVVAL